MYFEISDIIVCMSVSGYDLLQSHNYLKVGKKYVVLDTNVMLGRIYIKSLDGDGEFYSPRQLFKRLSDIRESKIDDILGY